MEDVLECETEWYKFPSLQFTKHQSETFYPAQRDFLKVSGLREQWVLNYCSNSKQLLKVLGKRHSYWHMVKAFQLSSQLSLDRLQCSLLMIPCSLFLETEHFMFLALLLYSIKYGRTGRTCQRRIHGRRFGRSDLLTWGTLILRKESRWGACWVIEQHLRSW